MRVIYKYSNIHNFTCFIEYNVVKRHNLIVNISTSCINSAFQFKY